ncbi:glycosyltransferase family 39 protein [Candidatus Margulisiibacteriota bacterium]
MFLMVFLVLINLFKIGVARYFPLIGDEAYYWMWTQHLELSYIAHPPMIAYVNFLLTGLFGNNEFIIRLGAIAIVGLISWIIYRTGRELYGPGAAATAVIIFNLLPTFCGGGMFLVPQTILFLFWSLSFYILVLIVKHKKPAYWYLLGLTAGLGLLSDYIMALFFIGTLIYLLVDQQQRFWLTKKEPYLAAILSLIVFSPVIGWNLKLGFAPFLYWGGRMGEAIRIWDNLLNFFGLQAVLYTLPIFIMTAIFVFRRKHAEGLLFSVFAAVVFLPFALVSPLINVGGHWPATAYLPAILATNRAKKTTVGAIVGFALLVNILAFSYYLFLYPTPAELQGQEFTINQQLPQFLAASTPKTGQTFYLASDIGMIGLVAFHGQVKVFSPPGHIKQMDLWGTPDIKKGDNVIYFSRNTVGLYEKLKPLFKKVWIDPQKRLFTKDADIPNKTKIYHCLGYQGGKLP